MPRLAVTALFEYGHSVQIPYVTSRVGDFKSPNPHSYKVLECFAQIPYSQTAWYGYSGSMVADFSLYGDGIGVSVPTELFQVTRLNTGQTIPLGMVDDNAMAKVFEKLRGNSELLVDFSERSSTLKMVKSALLLKRKMLKFVRDMASFKTTNRKRYEAVSALWLEYRYGWTPLVHSIYDAADNLIREYQNETLYIKGRSSWKNPITEITDTALANNHFIKVFLQYETSCRTEYRMNFSPPPPTQQMLSNWVSINPLSFAWETLPLSFVADWFVNVGDQLRAWENWALYYQYFTGGSKTVVVREVRTGTYFGGTPQPMPKYGSDGGLVPIAYSYRKDCRCSAKFVDFNRTLVLSLPVPGGFRFEVNLNAKRVTDAAALASGAWKTLPNYKHSRR